MAAAVPTAPHRAGTARWGRSVRRTASVLQWVVAGVGAICVALTVAAAALDLEPLVVQSGSMAPAVPTGSVVLARAEPAADAVPGDVVGLPREDGVLLHRLVSTRAEPTLGPAARVLVTKGDANDDVDAAVTTAQVLHPVLTVTGTGRVVELARGRWMLFWTGVVAGVLVTRLIGGSRGRRKRTT